MNTGEPIQGKPCPTVSLIVLVYNERDFIEQCLADVARQDYPPGKLEILFVDGGSTDGTRETVQRHIDEGMPMRLLDNPQRVISSPTS